MLINSLLSHASDARWEEFIAELERLNVRKAVVVGGFHEYVNTMTNYFHQRLMSLHIMEDLTSCILDFQANIIRVTYRKKTTLVDPDAEPSHAAALQYIWSTSKLMEDTDENGSLHKWRKLGFDSEDIVEEFGGVGVLGLDCFVSAAKDLSILS